VVLKQILSKDIKTFILKTLNQGDQIERYGKQVY